MAAKPVIILLHGAWHQPVHWDVVKGQVQSRGYEVDAPALPSATTTKIDDPLTKDVEFIKQTISRHTEAGRNIVLVMHSFAGVTGSEAVAELHESASSKAGQGRVLHLFYISSHILEPGKSVGSDGSTLHVWDVDDDLVYHLEPYNRFYNTTPPPIARAAITQLLPQTLHSFTKEVSHRGWADCGIPVTYLACKQDRALEYDTCLQRYKKRLESAGIKKLSLFDIDSDHTPWLSAEEEFFEILWEVIGTAQSSVA